jgi:hypothetical protein
MKEKIAMSGPNNQDPAVVPAVPVTPAPPAQPAVPATPPSQPARTDMVELAPEAYNALLDRLDELEGLALNKSKPSNIDDLANAGNQRVGVPKSLSEDDINEMKPTQIINLVLQHVNDTQVKPLLVKIEEMNIRDEIKDITKDEEDAKLFESLKEEIYQVASKNPTLSLKQAFLLAKESEGSVKPNSSPSNKDSLRHLPPRQTIPGEKPNTARVTVGDKVPETRRDAATEALAEMRKAGKI